MHLTSAQSTRFSKLFYSLLTFADYEYDPLEELAESGGPGNPFDTDYFTPLVITELCSFLFNVQGEGRNLKVIDTFLADNPDGLPEEDLSQIAQWKDAYNGPVFVVESSPQGTLLMGNGSLFSVHGVTRDACEVVGEAPAMTIATLLPFDGVIVMAGTIPSYPLDQRSGLQERILFQGRKLRADGHICTTADELIREAPLLRLRNVKDHDECVSLTIEDLVISVLEKMQEEAPDESLWGDDLLDEDVSLFDGPVPTHAGALAGLTGEERAAAVEAYLSETMAIQVVSEKEYFHCPPVRTLAQILDCKPQEDLLAMAEAMGPVAVPGASKEQLVAALREIFVEMSPMAAFAYLAADISGISELAERAWRAGGMLEMSKAEHDALPEEKKWRAYDPFLNIFAWEDRIAAVIPSEIADAMGERDWGFVRTSLSYRKHVRHLVAVYLDLCGVISLEQLTELYLRYYPGELGHEDFMAFLENDGPSNLTQYDLWTYQGETYAINPMLVGPDVSCELRFGEGARICGDELDEDDSMEHLRRFLISERQDEPWEVPGKTAAELEAYDFFHALEQQPGFRALQEYLDAHVPDDEDEYLYADAVIALLIEMTQVELDPDDIIDELCEMGLYLEGTPGSGAMLMLVSDFLIEVPRWTHNGWSARGQLKRNLGL